MDTEKKGVVRLHLDSWLFAPDYRINKDGRKTYYNIDRSQKLSESWYRGFDDSEWEQVNVPHDFSVTLPFSQDYSSGTGYLAGGCIYYRTHFTLPKEYEGKHIEILFDGVYKNSMVWCNSYYLGKRPYGYSEFSYDISHAVYFGGEDNVLTVKVVKDDLADSRWFTGFGITRDVYITVAESVHVANHGVVFSSFVTDIEPDASYGSATLNLKYTFLSDVPTDKKLSITTEFVAEGENVPSFSMELSGLEVKTDPVTLTGSINAANILLWSTDHPNLYTMNTWFDLGAGRFLADSQKVGVRKAVFDASKGFFLNGQNMKIKGVCIHHDAGCLGAAVPRSVLKERLLTLMRSGCNAIRCSHNPHNPALYDLCDELGLLVMDEAFDEWENPKNKWHIGHNVYPPMHQGYYEDFPAWGEEDIKTMVRRDRNHASVILWSIGNEIDYPNDPYCHPSFASMTGNNDAGKNENERRYDFNKPNAMRLVTIASKLVKFVKEEDDTRPVCLASAFPELSFETGLLDTLDVAGYNYKEHLYEKDHKRNPKRPIIGSENGHGYKEWLAVRDNDHISGQFLWTGIDYLGEAHGWPIHGSAAGILDLAGIPKASFYKAMSYWSDKPVLRIFTRSLSDGPEDWRPCNRRWEYEPSEDVVIKIYTNLTGTKLMLNGHELTPIASFEEKGELEYRCRFEKGELVAEGNFLGDVLTDSLRTPTGEIVLKAVSDTRDSSFDPDDGIRIVRLALTDSAGNRFTSKDTQVTVTLSGNAKLLGLENGDLADNTSYSLDERNTYLGRLTAYIKKGSAENVTVTATCEYGSVDILI